MRVLLAAAFALASADAATRVAVIELGKSGTVRRTTASEIDTSAEGVVSFWSALHGYGRKLQHAGMSVVPDLFSRPESGVVVGLDNVDLDNMPHLNALMTKEGENGVVGHMEVPGHQSAAMLKHMNVDTVEASSFANAVQKHSNEAGISGLKMGVTSDNASEVDAQIAALVNDASNSGKSVVLHLVIDEDDGAARRRRLARRLASGDEGEGEGDNEEENDKDGEEQDQNNNQNDDQDGEDGQQQQYNGYYGYGYYNAYGEWVSGNVVVLFFRCCGHGISNVVSLLFRLPRTRPCSKSNTLTLSCGLRLVWLSFSCSRFT